MVVPVRRKEVQLGKLSAIAIVTTLYCGTVNLAFGAALDDTKSPVIPESSPSPATPTVPRPEPPVAPRKYLETGARLFNKGRYELAAKYFEAAQLYRDRLTSNERVVLDLYREKFDAYSKTPTPESPLAGTVPRDTEVKSASTESRSSEIIAPLTTGATEPALAPVNPFGAEPPQALSAVPASPLHGALADRDTADVKQKARWLLQVAREQMVRREYDAAERSVAEARTFRVKWGYFDETPDKMTAALAKARAKNPGSNASAASERPAEIPGGIDTNTPHDRRSAKTFLRDARNALNAGKTDRAEAIIRELRTWDLRYGLFEDTPDKVSVAISEARRHEAARTADLMVRSYLGTTSRPDDPSRKEVPPPTQAPEPASTAPR